MIFVAYNVAVRAAKNQQHYTACKRHHSHVVPRIMEPSAMIYGDS